MGARFLAGLTVFAVFFVALGEYIEPLEYIDWINKDQVVQARIKYFDYNPFPENYWCYYNDVSCKVGDWNGFCAHGGKLFTLWIGDPEHPNPERHQITFTPSKNLIEVDGDGTRGYVSPDRKLIIWLRGTVPSTFNNIWRTEELGERESESSKSLASKRLPCSSPGLWR
jgi:hypothetical protein